MFCDNSCSQLIMCVVLSTVAGWCAGGWDERAEEAWRAGLVRLREELVLAHGLVREANLLAEELVIPVNCSVTLQAHRPIPHWGGGRAVDLHSFYPDLAVFLKLQNKKMLLKTKNH